MISTSSMNDSLPMIVIPSLDVGRVVRDEASSDSNSCSCSCSCSYSNARAEYEYEICIEHEHEHEQEQECECTMSRQTNESSENFLVRGGRVA